MLKATAKTIVTTNSEERDSVVKSKLSQEIAS